MQVALLSNETFRISDPIGWEILSFSLSPDETSFYKLFDSSFSTPARYVQEMYYRLVCAGEPDKEAPKFIFNPLFSIDKQVLILALSVLAKSELANEITLLVDRDGLVLGYYFPPWLTVTDARFLVLLSTVRSDCDSKLLAQLFSVNVRTVYIKALSLEYASSNGFARGSHQRVYEWVANHALAVLEKVGAKSGAVEARQRRDSIPFHAFMPHHAGDVLFFTLAWKRSQTDISAIATNKVYEEIARDNAPGLDVSPLAAPVANRDEEFRRGRITPDVEYLETVAGQLEESVFYCYYRSSRDYNLTQRHLIDHFAFAMGAHFCNVGDTFLTKDVMPSPALMPPVGDRKRVLLHFDGGWPMKVYPKSLQERLIDLLFARGYEITLLVAESYTHPKCKVITFEGYAAFKSMLRENSLMVGMDSFPCHYAAHILGLPTICLFSSTRPGNSDAIQSEYYMAMERGMTCRPCYAVATCPLYGGDQCRNFVEPMEVALAVDAMLSVNFPVHAACSSKASTRNSWGCGSHMDLATNRVCMISLRWAAWHGLWAIATLPVKYYLRRVTHEFFSFAKQEGYAKTSFRAVRYILRKVRVARGGFK